MKRSGIYFLFYMPGMYSTGKNYLDNNILLLFFQQGRKF